MGGNNEEIIFLLVVLDNNIFNSTHQFDMVSSLYEYNMND